MTERVGVLGRWRADAMLRSHRRRWAASDVTPGDDAWRRNCDKGGTPLRAKPYGTKSWVSESPASLPTGLGTLTAREWVLHMLADFAGDGAGEAPQDVPRCTEWRMTRALSGILTPMRDMAVFDSVSTPEDTMGALRRLVVLYRQAVPRRRA